MNATMTMTLDRVHEIAAETINAYRERNMDRQSERDGWLKTLNDWQGWDSGVIVLSPEEFREAHEAAAEGMPEDCVATVHSGYAGSQYVDFIRVGDDASRVADAVLGCLMSED